MVQRDSRSRPGRGQQLAAYRKLVKAIEAKFS
jgi:hypothetical protein